VIVVDSSVWASYFNGDRTPATESLDALLDTEEESVAVLPVIITEVLQGFRSDKGFREAAELLSKLPIVEPDVAIHGAAADLYRKLRKQGISIRGTIDCLIAAACISHEVPLLTLDRDFAVIARHTDLRLFTLSEPSSNP
jgi:hypothetical protein